MDFLQTWVNRNATYYIYIHIHYPAAEDSLWAVFSSSFINSLTCDSILNVPFENKSDIIVLHWGIWYIFIFDIWYIWYNLQDYHGSFIFSRVLRRIKSRKVVDNSRTIQDKWLLLLLIIDNNSYSDTVFIDEFSVRSEGFGCHKLPYHQHSTAINYIIHDVGFTFSRCPSNHRNLARGYTFVVSGKRYYTTVYTKDIFLCRSLVA